MSSRVLQRHLTSSNDGVTVFHWMLRARSKQQRDNSTNDSSSVGTPVPSTIRAIEASSGKGEDTTPEDVVVSVLDGNAIPTINSDVLAVTVVSLVSALIGTGLAVRSFIMYSREPSWTDDAWNIIQAGTRLVNLGRSNTGNFERALDWLAVDLSLWGNYFGVQVLDTVKVVLIPITCWGSSVPGVTAETDLGRVAGTMVVGFYDPVVILKGMQTIFFCLLFRGINLGLFFIVFVYFVMFPRLYVYVYSKCPRSLSICRSSRRLFPEKFLMFYDRCTPNVHHEASTALGIATLYVFCFGLSMVMTVIGYHVTYKRLSTAL
jgi:hypothetical protein